MISRLGPFNRSAFSGMCRTRDCWPFSLSRQPRARRGRLLRSGVLTFAFLAGADWLERAWRRPAGIDVGEVQRVKLRPKDVALGSQRAMRFILFLARVRVLHNPGEGEVRVFGHLREAAGEIVETAGKPGVKSAESIDAKGDELARKEFRER